MFSVQQCRCIYEYDHSKGVCFCWEWICWLQAYVGRWGVGFPQIHHEQESVFTFFAWKTARMYEFIIQCTGLKASCFCLGFRSSKLSHCECSSPVNDRCTLCKYHGHCRCQGSGVFSISYQGELSQKPSWTGCAKLPDLLRSCLQSENIWSGFWRTWARHLPILH